MCGLTDDIVSRGVIDCCRFSICFCCCCCYCVVEISNFDNEMRVLALLTRSGAASIAWPAAPWLNRHAQLLQPVLELQVCFFLIVLNFSVYFSVYIIKKIGIEKCFIDLMLLYFLRNKCLKEGRFFGQGKYLY